MYKVCKYLDAHHYKSIFEWTKINNVNIDINEWLHAANWRKRREVAKTGYRLDDLINHEDYVICDEVNNHLEDNKSIRNKIIKIFK